MAVPWAPFSMRVTTGGRDAKALGELGGGPTTLASPHRDLGSHDLQGVECRGQQRACALHEVTISHQ